MGVTIMHMIPLPMQVGQHNCRGMGQLSLGKIITLIITLIMIDLILI